MAIASPGHLDRQRGASAVTLALSLGFSGAVLLRSAQIAEESLTLG
jgi:hypothetical protein